MIAFIEGKVILQKANYLIVLVGGIGYKVFINPIKKYSEEIALFVHEHIKEDGDDFYGFLTSSELEIFEKLLLVNGIGPKAAMAIVSIASPKKIAFAIESQDFAFFESVSGIGKKAAAKIIIDLKSKLDSLDLEKQGESTDVIDALLSLGFKKADIIKQIQNMPADLINDEERVRYCLKYLSNPKL